MKTFTIITIAAVLGLAVGLEVCDPTCLDTLEVWNLSGDDRECDEGGEKINEMQLCRDLMGVDDPQNAACDPQKPRAEAVFLEIQNFFNDECSEPETPTPAACDSDERRNEVNAEVATCKAENLDSFALNGFLTKTNICKRLQAIVTCLTDAVGDCRADLEPLVAGDVISQLLMAELFGCSLSVYGNTITKSVTDCRYMEMVKCYNPVLKAFGQTEITDTYDLDLIGPEVVRDNIINKVTGGDQATECGKSAVQNIGWSSVRDCIDKKEARCPYLSGRASHDIVSVSVLPRDAISELWSKYTILSAIADVQDYCSADCSDYAGKKSRISAAKTSLAAKITGVCGGVSAEWDKVVEETLQCRPLEEFAALEVSTVPDGPAHLSRCLGPVGINSPSSACSPSAQQSAYKKTMEQCTFKIPDIDQLTTNAHVCSRVQAVANCIAQHAGTCAPVAAYFHRRHAFFFGFVNQNFQCDIKVYESATGGVQFRATEQSPDCNYGTVMSCYKPLLDKFAAGGTIDVATFKKLLFQTSQSYNEIRDAVCSLLPADLDLTSMESCAEQCAYPMLTLPAEEEYSPTEQAGLHRSGNVLDIKGLKYFKDTFCHAGCDGMTFVSKIQIIVLQCAQTGTDNKLTRVPQEILYSHYMQRCRPELSDACGEQDGIDDCSEREEGRCPFLNLVGDTTIRQNTAYAEGKDVCDTQLATCEVFPEPTPRPTPTTASGFVPATLLILLGAALATAL